MSPLDQFDPFERRITDAIEEIAAAQPPTYLDDVLRLTTRTSQRRRWTLSERVFTVLASRLAPAALATVLVAVVGAVLLSKVAQTPGGPSAPPSTSVVGTPSTTGVGAPSPSSQDTLWTAIYARTSTDGGSVQIFAVAPDGSQRVVRSIAGRGPEGLDLAPNGFVSQTGAAFLYWRGFESSATGSIAVFDLGLPSVAPALVPMGAPVGPRWSATGLLAIPGYNPSTCTSTGPECWARVTILDPRTGATTPLGVLSLFGGGPSIVWARDGSGIWDGGRLKPLDGGANIPFRAGALFMDRRVGKDGLTVGDGAIFAWDGRTRLTLTETVTGGKHTFTVDSLPITGTRSVVAHGEVPDGAFGAQLGEPDPADAQFPIFYSTGPVGSPTWNEGPVVRTNGTLTQPFGGNLLGWVPSALSESWPTTP